LVISRRRPIGRDLNAQVFRTKFAKRPKYIDVALSPVFRITKISIGEVVGFDDASHDRLYLRDAVKRGEEPLLPGKRMKSGKL
jgi:hypothetical protein